MRIINGKLYLLMILVFVLLILFTWKNNKKNIKNKAINKVLYIIPILWLLLFIYLKFIFEIKKIQIYFLDTLNLSFFSTIIMLLAVQISKNIILFIRDKALSTKYGGKKLTNKELAYINNKEETNSILWSYILTFIICGIIYSIIGDFISNENKLLETSLTALFSTICYWFIFKKFFTSSK